MNAELSAPFRDVLRFARRRHPEGGCSEVREPGVRRNNLGPFIVHESRPRPSLHTGRLCIRRAALDVVHVAPSASCPVTNPRPPAPWRYASCRFDALDRWDTRRVTHASPIRSVHSGMSLARAELGVLA